MGLRIVVAQYISSARLGQLTNKDNPQGTLETALGGTVTLAAGSTAVVGAGTTFTTSLVVGAVLSFSTQPGTSYVVASITSDTALVLSQGYTGSGAAGVSVAVAGINLNALQGAVWRAQQYFTNATAFPYDDTTAEGPPPTGNKCHFAGVPLVIAHLYQDRAQPWPEAEIKDAWDSAKEVLRDWNKNYGAAAYAPFTSNSQFTPTIPRGLPVFDDARIARFVPRPVGPGGGAASGIPNDWTGP